jgi:hypothetical protein
VGGLSESDFGSGTYFQDMPFFRRCVILREVLI